MTAFRNKYIDGHESVYVLMIFTLGWIGLLLQHLCVGMYFDDYGNAALTYGYNVADVNGTNYNIADIFEWAKWIYFNWGGRLLYACLFLIPMLKNGITLYMVVQSLVITLTLYMLYKLICYVSGKAVSMEVAFLMFVLYGLIGMTIHGNGTYWASASILYVWPLLPLLITIYYYYIVCDKIKSGQNVNLKLFYVVEGIGIVFSTLSQEQIGGSVVVFFIMFILLHHLKDFKRYLRIDSFVILFSIISYTLLFAAPGNFVRMASSDEFSSLSLVGKVTHNLPIILNILICRDIEIFNLLIIIANVFALYMIIKKNKGDKLSICIGLTTLLISGLFIYRIIFGSREIITLTLTILFLLNTAVVVIRYFNMIGKVEFFSFLVAAVASVFCLIISPSIVHRSFIQYIFFIFAYIGIVFINLYREIDKNVIKKTIFIVMIMGITFVSAKNYYSILKGYYENKFYDDYNRQQLENWNKKKDEDKESVIVLLKYPNKTYRGLTAGDKSDFSGVITGWLHEYYNIPGDVEVKWTDLKTYDVSNIFTEYLDGFYDVEGTIGNSWRWSKSSSKIGIYNFTDQDLVVVFKSKIVTESGENAKLSIKSDSTEESFSISGEETEVKCEVTLKPGDNIIELNSDAKPKGDNGDERELSLRLKNTSIKLKVR